MKKKTIQTKDTIVAHPVSIFSYVLGFIFAASLTLIAYSIVVNTWLSGTLLIGTIMGLAAVQLLVQLVFFLHLGREKGSRWNVASFYFMFLVLVVIVAGSLWIMDGLNYNMTMTPEQMNERMLSESKKGF